ncbi:MAG: hypothetical protein EOP84_15570 [Verrucomicrobiaceae bacterium]|nr:MAG: hypothetical protein EOP84_15570 [Verrucomicrobiaceae bacterium]
MRTLIIAALSLAAAAHLSAVELPSKFLGTWSGTVTFDTEGEAMAQKTTTTYKKNGKSGYIVTTIIKARGITAKGITYYYKSGKLSGELKRDGAVIAVASGTWSVSKNTLKEDVRVKGMFPSYRTVSKATLTSSNRLSVSDKSDSGERSSGVLTRK